MRVALRRSATIKSDRGLEDLQTLESQFEEEEDEEDKKKPDSTQKKSAFKSALKKSV